ncbi:MAG: hypothetical protein LBI56_01115 [Puniceicoccales bacterium]|nr:hypothetical protein [Puniceicoccales bacterium]
MWKICITHMLFLLNSAKLHRLSIFATLICESFTKKILFSAQKYAAAAGCICKFLFFEYLR